MNKKHIVFDMDDTLSDAYQFNQDMFVQTFKPHLKLLSKNTEVYLRQLHHHSRGTSMATQFESASKALQLTVPIPRLVQENEALHIKNIGQVKIFPKVRDLLTRLKSTGTILSICTNRQTQSLTQILKANRLNIYFTNIISCSDAGHEKPDPFCLNQLISRSKLSKQQYLYIGDSPTDAAFANNAGVEALIIDHYQNQKLFYKNLITLM